MQDKTFLALGDSYTIGEGAADSGGWPAQLVGMLRRDGVGVSDPRIIAKTGWTTDELSAAIDAARIDGRKFDLVTLLIGVNNQYRGRDAEEYRAEFTALLKRAIAFADGRSSHVIVVSIPDWGVTPFAKDRHRDKIAREIDQFNQINREETLRAGARYVDITQASRSHPDQIAPDGLHPSAEMYTQWAESILPQAKAILSQR
ncbi:MAG: SGNH/GDSL hydrolase family protein [Tepidisphaeraceae bacterium]